MTNEEAALMAWKLMAMLKQKRKSKESKDE